MRKDIKKVIIWGLKSTADSHRYIHEGFFNNFKDLGYDTIWLDDDPKYNEAISDGSLVLTANIAGENLKYFSKAKYVYHNCDKEEFKSKPNVLNLQVYTNKVIGKSLGTPGVFYSEDEKCLYQPWGIPIKFDRWLPLGTNFSRMEVWIGSIWQNIEGQGNIENIEIFRGELEKYGISFKAKGGSSRRRLGGIRDQKYLKTINRNPLGTSIVGSWQAQNQYVPCRLFKSIASGKMPSSNGDYSFILGGAGVFNSNIEKLVAEVMDLSRSEIQVRFQEARQVARNYTYDRALTNILEYLG